MAAHTSARVGCCHYTRRSKFSTPCCNKIYYCRFCHDENENHTLDRKEVVELWCAVCNTRQGVRKKCIKCNVEFGKYACLKCKLFDDEDKKQFHCDGCGICRIGGRENFFHCITCNICLPLNIQNTHKCIMDVSHQDCSICLQDIHSSRIPARVLNCGHLLHTHCADALLEVKHFACPLCRLKM